MHKLGFAGLGLCLALAAVMAKADDMILMAPTISGKTISMTLPDGTCTYNRKEKADAKILDAMEKADPRNQMLVAFIDCENLKAVRGTKGSVYVPGYYGQILSGISGQAVADNYTREAYVQAISAQYGAESAEKAMDRGEDTLKALLANKADDGKPQTIGVIKRDKDFIQIGMLGSMQTPMGEMQKIINVVTLTKIGVPVSIYLAHPATGDMSLRALSERSELYTRQLISLNPDEFSFFASLAKGVDTASALAGALGGFSVGLFIGILFGRRH
jgi:hypothetical protein